MTVVRHDLTAADRAAIRSFRAGLAANSAGITRASFNALLDRVPPAESVDYSESSVGGVPGVWCVPSGGRAAAAMLYLHGGLFVYGSARAFRYFVGQIVARAGVPAFIADYRLAPEHLFPAALDDARTACRALAEQFGAGRVAVLGDSAGGGLALTLLREQAGVRCGVLMSPWTDLALTGGSLESKAAEDRVLSRAALEAGVQLYLGSQNRWAPSASPLYEQRGQTAPIQVHVGTAEILLDDSLRIGSLERIEVHEWEGMPHVFPSSIDLFEAARAALDLIAAFVRTELTI